MDFEAKRAQLAHDIDVNLGPFDPLHLEALRVVPRERFVREGEVTASAEDIPLPLDDAGLATISAPHAYLLSFRLLGLSPGDRLVELGSGSGYGAALASFIVGARGHVTTVEIDAALADRAKALVGALHNVLCVRGDAVESPPLWRDARKVVVTFAVDDVPHAWVDALPDAGILVAPVSDRSGRRESQVLVRIEKRGDMLRSTEHGGVRYVKNRSILVT